MQMLITLVLPSTLLAFLRRTVTNIAASPRPPAVLPHLNSRRARQQGFTLIELLVVMVVVVLICCLVIGLLALIFYNETH